MMEGVCVGMEEIKIGVNLTETILMYYKGVGI